MKKRTFTLVASLFGVVGIAGAAFVGSTAGDGLFAGECSHNGFHYAAKDASATEHGHVEFWTCCTCHEHFTEAPTTGHFTDAETPLSEIPGDVLTHHFERKHLDGKPNDYIIGANPCTVEGCTATHLVTTEEVDFTGTGHSADATFINGTPSWAKSVATEEGALIWSLGGNAGANRTLYLPRVDYTDYETTAFYAKTNTAGDKKISFGVNGSYDNLLPLGVYTDVMFEVTAVNSRTIRVTAQDLSNPATRTSQLVEHSSASGNEKLPIYAHQNGTHTYIGVNKLYLNHEHTITYQPSTEVIGGKLGVCDVCHEAVKTDVAMTSTDIDLAKNFYGASVEAISEGSVVKEPVHQATGTGIRYVFGSSGVEDKMWFNMPRVDFSLYSSVTFNCRASESWVGYGLSPETNDCIRCTGNMSNIVITIANVEGEYTASMTFDNAGWPSVGTVTRTKALTNSQVISGEKGFPVFAWNVNKVPNRLFDVNSITVVAK